MNRPTIARIALGGLVTVCAGLTATAAEWQVKLDPERTTIAFTLKATAHTVRGTAALNEGTLFFDPETGIAHGQILVDAASVETGNGSRDKKMHTKVLMSAEHPRVVLTPLRLGGTVAAVGTSSATLYGSIEIIGLHHDITIPLQIGVEGRTFTASADFTVPYVEWELRDPSTFILRVAKEVTVRVNAEGTVAIDDQAP